MELLERLGTLLRGWFAGTVKRPAASEVTTSEPAVGLPSAMSDQMPPPVSAEITVSVNYSTHLADGASHVKRDRQDEPSDCDRNPAQPRPTAFLGQTGWFYCEECGCQVCGSANWRQHLEGRKHKAKSYQNYFFCDVCNVSVSGLEQYLAHLVGKPHERAEGRVNA